MTVTPMAVDNALAGLRQSFNADGADLAVAEATDEVVHVELVLTDETCHDCIVPTDLLTEVVEGTVRGAFPSVVRVVVSDPRA